MSLEPGTPIGKYIVRRKLAEGGMAEIYLASVRGPEGFEKDVVIKRIRAFLSTDPEFVQMFIAEARLASRLNHANIVQIFDFDKHEDTFYIAMEYVRGQSLWDVRKRSRAMMMPLKPPLVAHIGAEVARGLHYAHQIRDKGRLVGLVHRDVTPHNVLMSWEGAIKLTDFGIAKAGNKLTSPGMLKGKFAYMAPEQARGEEVDARTDVFALGIVLWEMLTGGRLFEGDSDVAVLRAVQHSVIAPPGRLNPEVPGELDQVVMRALERDPAKRFQTAQELERALGQFILRHAQSVDDTDLGGFLRRLYADELQEEGRERTRTGLRTPADPGTVPSRREPTAILPASHPTGPTLPPLSPDEDPHGDTWVVAKAKGSPPTLPLPPIQSPAPAIDATPVSATTPVSEPTSAPSSTAPGQGGAASVPPGEPTPAATSVPAPSLLQGRWPILGGVGALVATLAVAAVVVRGGPEPSGAADAGVTADGTEVTTPVVPDAGTFARSPDEGSGDEATEEWAAADAPGPDAGVGLEPVATDEPDRHEQTSRGRQARGKLAMNVTPWAIVYIDGESRGDISGKRELTLPVGRYLIRFQHPRKTTEKVVVIREGRRETVEFDVFRKD